MPPYRSASAAASYRVSCPPAQWARSISTLKDHMILRKAPSLPHMIDR